MNVRKKVWAVAALLLLLLGASAYGIATHHTAQADTRRVRIAYLPITHALPLFAQKELETPDGPVQLELVRYGSWPELMDALNTGKVDGAAVLVELAVKAREQGIDVRAAALGHKEGNVIVTRPDIEDVTDLRGKVFAIPHKQSSHKLLLDELLAAHDMTETDLTVVEMSPPEMPAGLAQGQIAGYCVAEPFGARSVLLGTGKVFMRSEDLWHDSLCCALVFNGDFVKEHGALARAMTQEYLRAGEYLDAHPEVQTPIALKYMKVKEDVMALSLKWISFHDLAISREDYAALAERMIREKLIETPPAYEDFVDLSLSQAGGEETAQGGMS